MASFDYSSGDDDDENGSDYISIEEIKEILEEENSELVIESTVRIVMVGKSGVGKSATGNSILGSKKFQSVRMADSVTDKCQSGKTIRDNKSIYLIDTPGLYSTTEENNLKHVREELERCIKLAAPGFHAVLFILSAASRFTDEDQKCFTDFFQIFGEKFYQYTIVVFTHADILESDDLTIENYVGGNAALKSFLERCGNRVVAINNKNPSQSEIQVNTILSLVDDVQKHTKSYYTNDDFKKAENALQQLDSKSQALLIRILSTFKKSYDRKLKSLAAQNAEITEEMKRMVTRQAITKEKRKEPCVIQ